MNYDNSDFFDWARRQCREESEPKETNLSAMVRKELEANIKNSFRNGEFDNLIIEILGEKIEEKVVKILEKKGIQRP